MKKKKKIVLFEEFESIRNVLVRSLKKKDFEVIIVGSLADSQQILNGSSFNLFIADNDNRNGVTPAFIKQMRNFSNYLYTPIILLISGNKEQYADMYKEYNIAGYLTKPFDMTHFISVVERLS